MGSEMCIRDSPKRAPGVAVRLSSGDLAPLLGALGPSLESLEGPLGRLEGVLGCSWELLGSSGTVFAAHEAINGSFWNPFVDSIHPCYLVMRFVDSIRSLHRSLLLHHVVDTYRLNNSAWRNVRSD